MANQFNTVVYSNGTIFGDMVITNNSIETVSGGKTRRFYSLECLKCGRVKKKLKKDIDRGSGMSHRSCCESVHPKDSNYKRIMSIWSGMRSRTTNENQDSWEHYKNISSESYKFFIDFFDDMHESYLEHVEKYGEENTTLDRINPYGDYEKSNIRWATRKIQNQPKNKKGFKWYKGVSPSGEVFVFDNQKEFALKHNLNRSKISSCISGIQNTHNGWEFSYEK